MPKQVQIKDGPLLTIEDNRFAGGGEGDLYRIIKPDSFRNHVVKLFKPEKQTKERESKINFLSSHTPVLEVLESHHPIIWVNKPVYQAGKFVGFTMPIAKGEKLELLCNLILPPKLGSEWKKFNFSDAKALELRQKICFNIAVAIHHIHSLEKYVLVDMKPENIMIQSNGLISIIDTDSVQVTDKGRILYHAPVVTPEYTPPEYYRGIKPETSGAPETWDRFSLAVIFYRLLCGIHPFVGSCNPPYENCNGFDAKIEKGLFPNGRNQNRYKVIPEAHRNFNKLAPNIRHLFIKCFDIGHDAPDQRPTIEEWCMELVPDALFNLQRPLPSSVNKFPNYSYLSCYPSLIRPKTNYPVISFPELPSASFFTVLLSKFRGLYDKEKKRALFKQQKSKVLELASQQQKYEGQFSEIINEYIIAQQLIIDNEKIEVGRLEAQFKNKLHIADDSFKTILNLEIKEAQDLRMAATTKISSAGAQISQVYNATLGNRNALLATKKAAFQSQVDQLEQRKTNDVKTALNDPNKLSKYTIAPAAKEIFNGNNLPQVIANLQKNYILSAADFTSVDSSGMLRKSNGSVVKIAGLGAARANLLGDWRRIVEFKEDNYIKSTIESKYQNELRQMNNDLLTYETEWKLQTKPLHDQYEIKKKELESFISIYEQDYKVAQEKLKIKYDAIFLDKETECKKTMHQIQEALRLAKQLFQSKLDENYAIYVNKINESKKNAELLAKELFTELEHLRSLHSELKKT